tara:strand:+ start:591 stop:788 length:198 start_codon:yes stop_codon:yes gene_type:complete
VSPLESKVLLKRWIFEGMKIAFFVFFYELCRSISAIRSGPNQHTGDERVRGGGNECEKRNKLKIA